MSTTGFLGYKLIKIEYTIVWYKFSQFLSDKGDDWWAKRILAIKYPNWQNSPNSYDMFSDVLENLNLYKQQYGAQILGNLKQNRPQPVSANEPQRIQPAQPEEPSTREMSLPPIHENCRCYIERMPGGRKIWQFSNNCCDECRALANEFNHTQFMAFGV